MNIEDYEVSGFEEGAGGGVLNAADCMEALEEVVDCYLDDGESEDVEEAGVGYALMDHLLSALSEGGIEGLDLDGLHDELGDVLEGFEDEGLRRAA